MKIFELTHIGEFHIDHNEDSYVIADIGDSKKLIAVMDGCSSGTDSHFASTMIGKVLRKLAKQETYRAFAERIEKSVSQLIEIISLQLFEELRDLSRMLDLKSDEVLSTLILAIVDETHGTAETIVVGDGVIHVNGESIEFENDNKPDYIGYHLKLDKHLWYRDQTEKRTFNNIQDFTIATDGIFTFKNFDGKSYPPISEIEIQSAFFINKENLDNQNKLKKTLILLKNKHGLMPSDDLTMIRMVL
jgi:hypothetical protein